MAILLFKSRKTFRLPDESDSYPDESDNVCNEGNQGCHIDDAKDARLINHHVSVSLEKLFETIGDSTDQIGSEQDDPSHWREFGADIFDIYLVYNLVGQKYLRTIKTS